MLCKGIITYIDDGRYLKANQKAFLTMVLTVVYFSHLALTLVNTHLVTTLSLPFNDTWAFLHIPLDPSYHQTKGKKRKLKLSGSCKSGGYDEKCLQHFHVYRIRNTDWHWHSCNWKNARCLCKLLAQCTPIKSYKRWKQVTTSTRHSQCYTLQGCRMWPMLYALPWTSVRKTVSQCPSQCIYSVEKYTHTPISINLKPELHNGYFRPQCWWHEMSCSTVGMCTKCW